MRSAGRRHLARVRRWQGWPICRAAPRLAASAAILTLAGIGLMPPPLLACAAAPSPAAGTPAPPAFADPDDLRYRIRRLQQPRAPGARATLILRLAGALLTFALAAAACQALHASAEWSGLVPCLAAFGYLGWRPTWRRRSPGTAR